MRIGLPNPLAVELYDNLFRGVARSTDAAFYMALLEADPFNDLSNWAECSDSGYVRKQVIMSANVDGVLTTSLVTFNTFAGSTIYPITHWGICADTTVGSTAAVLWLGELVRPREVDGTDIQFPAGAVVLNGKLNVS